MSGLEREDELESFLRTRVVVPPHVSGTEGLEPPRVLDELVLRKAREALRPNEPTPLYRSPRWAFPVALAATLLLSFSILLNFSLSTRAPETTASAPVAARVMEAPKAANSVAPMTDSVAPKAESMAPTADSIAPKAADSTAPKAADLQAQTSRQADTMSRANSSSLSTAAPAAKQAAEPGKYVEDPALWLKRIRDLRARGRQAEADEQLRLFRAAFPDYEREHGLPQ